MAQSLGVGTVMVILSHGKSDNYSEKWVNALSRDMAYIPEIKSITKRIAENKSDSNTPIISVLSQIASVIGSRQQHRIVFPPAVIMGLLTNKYGTFCSEMANSIDFAGKGAFYAYKMILEYSQKDDWFQVPKEKLIREIIYHAMFGTYLSDLGVLDK